MNAIQESEGTQSATFLNVQDIGAIQHMYLEFNNKSSGGSCHSKPIVTTRPSR
jgi:hypothetical protein